MLIPKAIALAALSCITTALPVWLAPSPYWNSTNATTLPSFLVPSGFVASSGLLWPSLGLLLPSEYVTKTDTDSTKVHMLPSSATSPATVSAVPSTDQSSTQAQAPTASQSPTSLMTPSPRVALRHRNTGRRTSTVTATTTMTSSTTITLPYWPVATSSSAGSAQSALRTSTFRTTVLSLTTITLPQSAVATSSSAELTPRTSTATTTIDSLTTVTLPHNQSATATSSVAPKTRTITTTICRETTITLPYGPVVTASSVPRTSTVGTTITLLTTTTLLTSRASHSTETIRSTTTRWTTITLPKSSHVAGSSTSKPIHSSVSSIVVKSSSATTSTSKATSAKSPAPSIDHHGNGLGDTYTFYSGDGALKQHWPAQDEWMNFTMMWESNAAVIAESCTSNTEWDGSPNNSPEEIQAIHDAIIAVSAETGVSKRFILAIVLQESKGCVRVPTTSNGYMNPGLMQTFKGTGSCNTHNLTDKVLSENGTISTPCPAETIATMIREGTKGIAGNAMSLIYGLAHVKVPTTTDVSRYYQAARIYNSGKVDVSGDLGKGIATHCYASDIANRLTGWVNAKSKCFLDPEAEPK